MLKGRLGLETARIPYADRHGLLWLSRGELCVVDGCLHFMRGRDSLTPTMDQIPHQAVSMILLGPGSSVTQDALRLLARHGTLMAAVGSLVMVWRDLNAVGGVGVANLGEPVRELIEADGMWLVRRRAATTREAL